MPMKLEGSCKCGAVSFTLDSNTPYPYQLCYCSICRKTAGGGGFAINIMGIYDTLKIKDKSTIGVYQVELEEKDNDNEGVKTKEVKEPKRAKKISEGQRNFCTKCSTPLWLWDKRWPELVHPFASVIDTELPVPPERVHLMLGSKASWVVPEIKKGDKEFDGYPEESIEDWHRKRKLWIE